MRFFSREISTGVSDLKRDNCSANPPPTILLPRKAKSRTHLLHFAAKYCFLRISGVN